MKIKLFLLFCFLFSGWVSAQHQNSATTVPSAKEKVILIYGSADCHYCVDTKAYLEARKIPYLFYDIDRDEKALREMLTKLKNAGIPTQGLSIPVIDKYGTLFTNNESFEAFLKKLD